MGNKLFVLCRLADYPHRILAAIYRHALMNIELFLDGRLGVAHTWVSRELRVAAFTDTEHRNVPNSFYYPESTFRHDCSLAHLGTHEKNC
jgi:hypothetical protein